MGNCPSDLITPIGQYPKMKTWRDRLKGRMEELNLNMKSLSHDAGLGDTTVRDILKRDRSPSIDALGEIAKVLDVSVGWLLGETPDILINGAHDLPANVHNRNQVEIPEYDVRASMGDGFAVDRETIKGLWTFSQRYLVDELRLTLNSLVMIEVIGDSMSPTLESGDRVLVDMSDRRVSNPGIFVLWDGDGTVAKRIELIPNSKPQKLMRISDNPHHGRYEVLAEETNIIGRIVWFARRL